MKKRFGKLGLFFTLTLMIITACVLLAVFAAEYDSGDGIKWRYTISGDNATITGVTLTEQTKEFVIPSTITADGKTYTVTAIGDNAFKDNKKVFGELTLPSTLTTIGNNAFQGTYIYGEIVIPESVTSIGTSAFYNCDCIIEVKLPSGITEIKESTFNDCYALGKVNTENIVTFGKNCFYNCRALHYITMGENARTVGEGAFYNCDSLDGIVDNSMLTSISSGAYAGCDKIEGFIIPNNLTLTTGGSGKKYFAPYEKESYSSYLSYPKQYMKEACFRLKGFYTLDSNENYSSVDGVLYSKDGTTLIKYPIERTEDTYTVSDKATTISKNAFYGTTNLTEVILDKALTTLEVGAFSNSSISFIYIPNNVKTIEFDTFKNCASLNTVILGEGVEVVASGAFNGSAVKLIIAGNDMVSPISTSSGAFYYANEYTCSEHIYGYNDLAPTCENYGYNKCIACLRYEYVKETNHNGAILEEHAPTCTEDGYRIVKCSDCGQAAAKAITEKAIGHVSNGKYYTISSGYKTPSVKYSSCLICGNMYVEEYSANFHLMGDVNCDSKINTNDLITLKKYIDNNSSVTEFSTSNADLNGDKAIDDKDYNILGQFLNGTLESLPESNYKCNNHNKKQTLEIIETSCSSDGFRIRYCVSCGKLTDEIVSPRVAHSFVETEEYPIVILPSCDLEGQRISFCQTCNTTVYETLDKLEHSRSWYTVEGQRGIEYSTCTVCGAFEHRDVDYSSFKQLVESLPLNCTCSTPCTDLTDKLTTHLIECIYKPETYNTLISILNNYPIALSQAEVDRNVQLLSDTLKNAQYNVTDVPTVFLDTVPREQKEGYVSTLIIVASLDENGVPKIDAIDYNGEVKIRGRSSDNHTKKPYNIKFSSAVDLFGLGGGKKYCLLSNDQDSTLLKNALMFELSELFGIENSCKYQVVDLYADYYSNAKFQGIAYRGSYLLVTPVDVGEDRVDIDKESDFLLEIEISFDTDDGSTDIFEQEEITSPIFKIRAALNEPEIEDLSGEAHSNLFKYMMQYDYAIQSGDWELIQQHIDVESVAKYYILHDYLKDMDIFWDSTRFYIEDGKLYGGPGWDFDLSMFWSGTNGGGQGESSAYKNNNGWVCEGGVVGDPTTGVWASLEWKYKNDTSTHRLWFHPLYTKSPEFVEYLCKTFAEMNSEMTLLYENEVDENGVIIRENIIDSIYLDEKISGSIKRNNDTLRGGAPTYNEDVKSLRNWLQKRNEWLQKFYADKLASMTQE